MTDEWEFQETVPVREARYSRAAAARLVVQGVLDQPSAKRRPRLRQLASGRGR